MEVSKQKDILRFSIHTHRFHKTDPQFPEIEVLVVILTSRDVMRLENKPDPMSHLEGLTSAVQNAKADSRLRVLIWNNPDESNSSPSF